MHADAVRRRIAHTRQAPTFVDFFDASSLDVCSRRAAQGYSAISTRATLSLCWTSSARTTPDASGTTAAS